MSTRDGRRRAMPTRWRFVAVAGLCAVAVLGQVISAGAQTPPATDPPTTTPSTEPPTTTPSTEPTTTTTAPQSTTTTTVPPSTTTTEPPVTALGVVSANEAPEFASATWSDPWDMSNRDDLLLDQPWFAKNMSGAAFADGSMGFNLTGNGFLSPLWNGISPGALLMGRDGFLSVNDIDAGTYRSVSIRIRASHPLQNGAIAWTRGRSANTTDAALKGGMSLSTALQDLGDDQWHTLTFPLVNNSANFFGNLAWSGTMNGLRLALNPVGGTQPQVRIDWIRLYQQDASGAVPNAVPEEPLFYKGTYNPPKAGPAGIAECGVLAGVDKTDLSALPGGDYQFFTEPGCPEPSSLPDTATLVPRPRPLVTAPSLAGGRDYATSYLKNQWDFSGLGDIVNTGNICGRSYSRVAGAYSAYNCKVPFTGFINDPFIELHVGKGGYAIPTYVFHRLTVEFTYEGAFSLNGGCHGGTIGRLMWQDTRYTGPPRQTQDFITYKDRSTFTIDLAQSPAVLNDGPASTRTPFALPAGHYVKYLRWDANEDTCARWFHLRDIKLRADDAPAANRVFNVKWSDTTSAAGDVVVIYARRAGGTGYTEITNPLLRPANSASGQFSWNTSGLQAGKYTVLVRVFRNGTYSDAVSTGPVTF